MTMTDRKSTHVVMLSATHDAELGDVVSVTADQAADLVAKGFAREPRSGEVKAAQSEG